MTALRLFHDDNPVAARAPKSDRLILARLLHNAALNKQLEETEINRAHAILIKWADLESSGKLKKKNEKQLQGEFLGDVFGDALGYTRFSEGLTTWSLEQHMTLGRQEPDAVLGEFGATKKAVPLAVVELKGPTTHIDRDRSNGRTAIQQCWEYLAHTDPKCRWGVVSNIVSFRLYERDSTPRRYEHFSLQSLRDIDTFRQFYVLFHRKGLIEKTAGQPPRAIGLLAQTNTRQREVGDDLYDNYSQHRTLLILHLHHDLKYSVDDAIEIVQRLFDRVIFIAFCEDRELLDPDLLERAHDQLGAFTGVTNPRWQNFKNLFKFVNKGNADLGIPAYNGGLFAESAADELELDDKWTSFFKTIGKYDFADEVNLDVLGHLFEKSITELEKLRQGGLFGGDAEKAAEYARMPQSAKRKRLGIYYTPQELTSRIVRYTVEELIDERFIAAAVRHGIKEADARLGHIPDTGDYWRECLSILRNLKIVDPACGSGAFLFQAYEALEHRYGEVAQNLAKYDLEEAADILASAASYILNDNLYGVDLSPEAVEITQLALWIRSARRGESLATLSRNIVHGNSLVHDPEVHPDGFDWKERFPEVFDRDEAGFDCVIGNPPWERIKLKHREFFSLPAPEILKHTNAAKQRAAIARLEKEDPELFSRYQQAKAAADDLLDYVRKSGEYPLTGTGDVNLYAVFAELGSLLVSPTGRVGMLTPSGIASDNTTKDFFASIAEANRLIRLYDFENKKVFFPEVHASFKFCILNFGGVTSSGGADYVFFVHSVDELEDDKRHIPLSGEDIKLLNPNTGTCPIFRTRRDAELTRQVYRRFPILKNKSSKKSGNPWGIGFKTLFHQSGDADKFVTAKELTKLGAKLTANRWTKSKKSWLPLYEAKMVQAFDHRASSVFDQTNNYLRHGQKDESSLVEHKNPEFLVQPRSWVTSSAVEEVIGSLDQPALIGFKNVTSPTNQRTMIAAMIPRVGASHSLQFIISGEPMQRALALLGNLNSHVYDYIVRQKIGGVNLSYYIVEQIPTLPPDTYDKPCPWKPKATLEKWISERVLKLTCTAEDMLPLAEACDFKSGSFKKEYDGRLHKWDPADRAKLMAELDAAYFILYGINRDDAEYILSTFSGVDDANTLLPGSRSTKQLILENYDDFVAQSKQ